MPEAVIPAYSIKPVALSKLKPYQRNARTHSDAQVKEIAASIQHFGFTTPLLIRADGQIVAGHGRAEAAKLLGLKDVPAMTVPASWTDADVRAYILADNKLALNADWNMDILKDELSDLLEEGFEIDLTGFDEEDIALILAEKTAGETDPDDVPDPPTDPVTQPGDLWILGNHRLLCGDSTVPEHVARLLDGAKPHLMVTDPPYGVVYDANWRNERVRSDGSPSDGRAIGKVMNDDRADWREAWALFPGDVVYVWCASLFNHVVAESLLASGYELRSLIIWAKSQMAIGRSDYHWQHEPCWYAVRKGRKGHYCGDRKQTTLWNINKPRKSETGHSTQKPVECMRRPIINNSKPGDAVYDPFLGSGTTMIAAEMEGRSCFGLELNPVYCDVIVRRWEEFTGKSAEHIPAKEQAGD